ncbi:hypothetical protein K1T71_012714 [Dendrolimus kikuchii]|uniref:Uncharacterized protein n=1 Tax=Dendrolimus kikuchii TaxID=765133 RepID=A0ACC1CKI6_9NEOP|nr:hypothetical protein K1T71_012714 [Dendrolimus kikuchii]
MSKTTRQSNPRLNFVYIKIICQSHQIFIDYWIVSSYIWIADAELTSRRKNKYVTQPVSCDRLNKLKQKQCSKIEHGLKSYHLLKSDDSEMSRT